MTQMSRNSARTSYACLSCHKRKRKVRSLSDLYEASVKISLIRMGMSSATGKGHAKVAVNEALSAATMKNQIRGGKF